MTDRIVADARPDIEIEETADWDAIVAALASALPGQRVRLAAGTWRGDRLLRIPAGVALLGPALERTPGTAPAPLARLEWTGRGSAIRIGGGPSDGPPSTEGAAGSGDGAELADLVLVAVAVGPEDGGDAGSGTLSALVTVIGAAAVAIRRCAIDGVGAALCGIRLGDCTRPRVDECDLGHCRIGVVLTGTTNALLTGNRCHDNQYSGIAFFSSTGEIKGNDCWGNGFSGIALGRDSQSPTAGSDATLTGNRCHDNQWFGIDFASSTGKVEGNDCWGNGLSGIALGRDSQSPAAGSDATLTGNRCHDNQGFGIDFASSTGKVEGNDCWGNGLSGIALGRDSQSPAAGSDATLTGNRCHDNQGFGIDFASSTGKVEGNDCWGNGHSGIVLQRDSDSPEAGSDATLTGNRCHDNQQAGILFFSSTGQAEGNDCWGNGRVGIALQRDSQSPEAGSDATLTGNRCHDNQGSGIGFVSSTGQAEGNDCWGNGLSGIALQRDPQSPEAGSDVTLTGNRCHDNQESGIIFGSSTGQTKGNDCWGNGHSGIVLQRDSQSPQAGSDATLTGNRCHDNQRAGIVFFSSTGQAEGNDCWGNGDSGIALGRDPDSPEAGSDATLTGNRCDHNRRFGIQFISSNGHCADNRCWANGRDDEIERVDRWIDEHGRHQGGLPCEVRIDRHRTTPPDEAELHTHRRDARPDRSLVLALESAGSARPALLANLLGRGCGGCFARWWADLAPGPGSRPGRAPADAESAPALGPDSPRLLLLDADPSTGQPRLRRADARGRAVVPHPAGVSPADAATTTPRPILGPDPATPPGLADLFTAFATDWLERRRRRAGIDGRGGGLAWGLAVCATDPAPLAAWYEGLAATGNDPEGPLWRALRDWARATGEPVVGLPRLAPPLWLDLAGVGPGGLGQALAAQLSAGRVGRERWRALAALPASAVLALLVLALLLGLGVAAGLVADLAGLEGLAMLGRLGRTALTASGGHGSAGVGAGGSAGDWSALTGRLAAGWVGLDWRFQVFWWLMPVAALGAWLSTLNLWLPRPLHLPLPGWIWLRGVTLDRVLDFLAPKGGDRGDGLRPTPAPWAGRLERMEHRATRRWVARRVSGGGADLEVLVLDGLGDLDAADRGWLRLFAAARRPGQGLLLIGRIADLGLLRPAWLDCWLGDTPAGAAPGAPDWRRGWDRLLLLYQPAATGVAPPAATNPPDRAAARTRLAGLLGAGEAGGAALIDALAHPTWVALDLLPTLVLGSTPTAPMSLTRARTDQPAQYGPRWRQAIQPFRALFAPADDDYPEPRLHQEAMDLIAHAARATALYLEKPPDGPRRLAGRAWARLELAHGLWAALGPGPATADYLARLIGCGERFHLGRSLAALGAGGDVDDRPAAQSLPLHLAAALQLLGERLAIGRGQVGVTLDLDAAVAADWERLGQALAAPLTPGSDQGSDRASEPVLSPDIGVHCWCLYLAALDRLERAARLDGVPDEGPVDGAAGAGLPGPRVAAALADLERALVEVPDAPGVAGQFLATAHALVARLRGLGPTLAEAVLDHWLGQAWWHLPAPFAARLRGACRDPAPWVQRTLIAALVTDPAAPVGDGAEGADAPAGQRLLAAVGDLRLNPPLVIAVLARLALDDGPAAARSDARPDPGVEPTLASRLAVGVWLEQIRAAVVAETGEPSAEPLETLPPPDPCWLADVAACARLRGLLADSHVAAALAAVLAQGRAERQTLSAHIALLDVPLPGLALGPLDPVAALVAGLPTVGTPWTPLFSASPRDDARR